MDFDDRQNFRRTSESLINYRHVTDRINPPLDGTVRKVCSECSGRRCHIQLIAPDICLESCLFVSLFLLRQAWLCRQCALNGVHRHLRSYIIPACLQQNSSFFCGLFVVMSRAQSNCCRSRWVGPVCSLPVTCCLCFQSLASKLHPATNILLSLSLFDAMRIPINKWKIK